MWKKKFQFKIFKVMKLTFNILFSQLLLRITFDDKFWRSHIDILYLSTQLNNGGHHEKQSILNSILLLLIGLWPRKPRLSYTKAIVWSTFTMFAPVSKFPRGGKLPSFRASRNHQCLACIHYNWILIILWKLICTHGERLGIGFWLIYTNSQHKSHVSPLKSVFMSAPMSYLALRTWDSAWSGKSQHPCSQ